MQKAVVKPEDWSLLLARTQAPRPQSPLPVLARSASAGALALYGPIAAHRGARLVVGQVGQSLDGRIATPSGDARDVSGNDGLAHLHRLRALVDAVVVGVGTILSDDPRLTVRLAEGPDPVRVVIDPAGRMPPDARALADDGVRRIVVQCEDVPRPAGVEVIRLPRSADGCLDCAILVDRLADLGLTRILVEGGALTLRRFIEADRMDRLHVAVAPLIIGAGPTGLALSPVDRLAEARRPEVTAYDLGTDILFDCRMKPPESLAEAAE